MEYLAKEFDENTSTWSDRVYVHVPNWGLTYPVKKQLDFVLRGTEDNEEEEEKQANNMKRSLGDDIFDTAIETINSATGYYDKLIKALVKIGYTENKNIVSAPYDWRNQPYDEWMEKTKKQIEKTYAENNNVPVILVAHSYGNIMTYLFLARQTKEWKDAYIRHYVAASPAYMGSPKAFVLGLTYTILDVSPKIPIYMQAMGKNFRNVPSLYSLMPYSKAYTDDPHVLEVSGKKYTFDEIPEVFKEVGIEHFDAKWKVSREMMKTHDESYNITPGVSTTIFYTSKPKSTYYKVKCSKTLAELQNYTDWIGSGLCEVVFKEGDGTITKEALIYPFESWKSSGDGYNYSKISIKNADHTSLISNKDFLKGVGEIIGFKKDMEDVLEYDISLGNSVGLLLMDMCIIFVFTLLVILSSFNVPKYFCPCSDDDDKKNNCCCCICCSCSCHVGKVRIYWSIIVTGIISIICMFISLFGTWLVVERDDEIFKFGIKKYEKYGKSGKISSLENCDACGGIQSAGGRNIACCVTCIILVVVVMLFPLIFECISWCIEKTGKSLDCFERINKVLDKRSTLWNMLILICGIIIVVFDVLTSRYYYKKVSKLSSDNFTKSFGHGFHMYISTIIPATAMVIASASELIGNSRAVDAGENHPKDDESNAEGGVELPNTSLGNTKPQNTTNSN